MAVALSLSLFSLDAPGGTFSRNVPVEVGRTMQARVAVALLLPRWSEVTLSWCTSDLSFTER